MVFVVLIRAILLFFFACSWQFRTWDNEENWQYLNIFRPLNHQMFPLILWFLVFLSIFFVVVAIVHGMLVYHLCHHIWLRTLNDIKTNKRRMKTKKKYEFGTVNGRKIPNWKSPKIYVKRAHELLTYHKMKLNGRIASGLYVNFIRWLSLLLSVVMM